jgi:hypothetical protein
MRHKLAASRLRQQVSRHGTPARAMLYLHEPGPTCDGRWVAECPVVNELLRLRQTRDVKGRRNLGILTIVGNFLSSTIWRVALITNTVQCFKQQGLPYWAGYCDVKTVLTPLVAASLVFNSGCAVIRDELRYPGGAPGRILDSRTFDASQSKQLQLLRVTLALAIAARIGEGSVSTEDADVFARQLSEAAIEINHAAIDAGYPEWKNGRAVYPCQVDGGMDRPGQDYTGQMPKISASYLDTDRACPGYYVNFEVNIARIESRIVRAMLTSLPTERAREFIEDLSSGSLLSAVVSLARSASDIAGAFHRGAGSYRAGIETVAASINTCQYDPTFKPGYQFDQRFDTVLVASSCLGLSSKALFDRDDIEAGKLPNQVDPTAFMALFRIVSTSCVGLPLTNYPEAGDERFINDRRNRARACDLLRFNPHARPFSITVSENPQGAGDPPLQPNNVNSRAPLNAPKQ